MLTERSQSRPWTSVSLLGVVGVALSALPACSSASGDPGVTLDERLSSATNVSATFRTALAGKYVSAEQAGGGAVNANRDVPLGWETFTLVDQNGGSLEGGDLVFVRTSGGYLLQAENGGGAGLNASSKNELDWETFRVVRESGAGPVQSGDVVGLQTITSGAWVSAENGGGGPVFAYGRALGSWERFTIALVGTPSPPPPPPPPQPPPTSGWKLVWADEFDGSGAPDLASWRYDVERPGWVNHELENYTYDRRENARLENGTLIIEGRRDGYQGYEYSSARLNGQSFLYGRFEVRARLPAGRGTWPAIWMMPDDMSRGWPACGEIDIMEQVGYDPGVIHATTHTQKYNWVLGNQKTATLGVPSATSDFHVYAVEWFADHLDVFVDATRYFTYTGEGGDDTWPFDKPFHLILNLAIGGDWGGAQGVDSAAFPQRMEVDYVRIYQAQ